MSPPFYTLSDDGRLLPSSLAAGPPWLPGTQHGSMITALMARAIDTTSAATAMHLSRLTVDLSRPVPIGATAIDVTVIRDGRRLQVLDLVLSVDGSPCSRANAIRIRTDDDVVASTDEPAPWSDDIDVPRPTDAVVPSPLGPDRLWDAHEARWVAYAPGEGAVWLRPSHPLVEGERPSDSVRAALVADLVMTGGGLLAPDRYVVVNPDLTLMLTCPPRSEWILIRSRVRLGPRGTGQSEGAIYDEHGWIGRATKSLLVDRR